MLHAIGVFLALAGLVAAVGWSAHRVANAPRAPAPVRRGAAATSQAIRHPVRTARNTAPKAASATEEIWARARAEDWREKRQAQRQAKAARAEARAQRPPRRFLPRVAVHVPGVTDRAAHAAPLAPVIPITAPAQAAAPRLPAPGPVPSPSVTQPITGRPAPMPGRYSAPPDHAAVIHRVAQFEPETDGALIAFMAGEAAGTAGYAEALEHLSEHLLNGVGLDPASVEGVHEFAEAMSEGAGIMARASAKFQARYQGVRETVAAGTRLPHRGEFMTGEDA